MRAKERKRAAAPTALRNTQPMRDASGVLIPERDTRYVPGSTMAQYLGVCAKTIYSMALRGAIPASAIVMHGRRRYYIPAVFASHQRAGAK